jgi:G3E family GTPase
MDLNCSYPIVGQGDTLINAQKFLDNLLIRTNFILNIRTALGWRGLHPVVKSGLGWTCKIKGSKGVYGIYLHSSKEADGYYHLNYKLAYFPLPEEEVRMRFALETAIIAGRDEYMNLVRNFVSYPDFTDLFFIANIDFTLEKDSRDSLSISMNSQKWHRTISEKGIYSVQDGRKICIIEPSGLDQNLPSYQLALPFFEVLASTITYNLSVAPEQLHYSQNLCHNDDPEENCDQPLEIHLVYNEDQGDQSLTFKDKSLAFSNAKNAIDTPFAKAKWWSSHLPFEGENTNDIFKAIDRPQLIILTGFLGSGKTSFLKHFIEYHTQNNRFVAVIQNEIGQKGLDSHLLEDSFGVVEIDEGCVCCSLSGQLKKGIHQVKKTYNPDVIILETTGLANPFNLLNEIEEIRDLVRFDSITTVVDALNLKKSMAESNIVSEQIKAADIIVLNKVDLVEKDELESVRELVQSFNSKALEIDSVKGDLNPALLYVADKDQISLTHSLRYHCNHMNEKLGSVKKDMINKPIHEFFDAFIRNLPEGVFRCKGQVAFSDMQGIFILQYVNGRYELEEAPKSAEPDYYLVFIGKNECLNKLEFPDFLGDRVV